MNFTKNRITQWCYILWFVEKIHARNIKCIPFFTPLPSFLFLVVSCFCAACLREEFGGWGPFYLIADLRVFSVWCMLAWKFIFSTKHCTLLIKRPRSFINFLRKRGQRSALLKRCRLLFLRKIFLEVVY